jgi:hypothetical protein
MKYSLTFKPETPGGYAGTHWFDTIKARAAFLSRFRVRVGLEHMWIVGSTNANDHTAGEWIFDAGDNGDDSVGMAATPACVYADVTQPGDSCDGNVYPICTLDNPVRPRDGPRVDEYDEGIEQSGDIGANGMLIAAAPRLLEALRACVVIINELPSSKRKHAPAHHVLEQARKALASAAGRPEVLRADA